MGIYTNTIAAVILYINNQSALLIFFVIDLCNTRYGSICSPSNFEFLKTKQYVCRCAEHNHDITYTDDKEISKQETNQDSVDSIHLIIIMSLWLTVKFHLLKSLPQ